jgi:hypothetical protein
MATCLTSAPRTKGPALSQAAHIAPFRGAAVPHAAATHSAHLKLAPLAAPAGAKAPRRRPARAHRLVPRPQVALRDLRHARARARGDTATPRRAPQLPKPAPRLAPPQSSGRGRHFPLLQGCGRGLTCTTNTQGGPSQPGAAGPQPVHAPSCPPPPRTHAARCLRTPLERARRSRPLLMSAPRAPSSRLIAVRGAGAPSPPCGISPRASSAGGARPPA